MNGKMMSALISAAILAYKHKDEIMEFANRVKPMTDNVSRKCRCCNGTGRATENMEQSFAKAKVRSMRSANPQKPSGWSVYTDGVLDGPDDRPHH